MASLWQHGLVSKRTMTRHRSRLAHWRASMLRSRLLTSNILMPNIFYFGRIFPLYFFSGNMQTKEISMAFQIGIPYVLPKDAAKFIF
ncbi:hypothetical protein TIFTF001_041522 [Ficus carica]|uniref:Uncharacterized protein n=1 Tax=Ficus carica TaxID=3494 RepID=A0AA88CQK6_FICCA|nr:hypothetical protein TIFTF001_041522 [Ficus carica]